MSKRVLIIAPSWVGDMVMAQSLLLEIKRRYIDIEIDVLAPEWNFAILGRMPEISRSIVMPVGHGKFGLLERYRLGKSLRSYGYDWSIVLPNSWKSALIPWFAKIKRRTGWLGEARWGLLNDVRYLDKHLYPRMVQRYVALGLEKQERVLNYLTPKLSVDKTRIEQVKEKFQLDLSKPVLALCPGAAYGPAKRWPEKYFVECAKTKQHEGWQVWFFGSIQDKPVIEKIQQELDIPGIDFAGKINLLETVDILSMANAVISNDSGLMHIAASLDKPVIAIYGSTSPEFTPPLGDKSKIIKQNLPCSPCFKRECPLKHLRCMHEITPQHVLQALDQLCTSSG